MSAMRRPRHEGQKPRRLQLNRSGRGPRSGRSAFGTQPVVPGEATAADGGRDRGPSLGRLAGDTRGGYTTTPSLRDISTKLRSSWGEAWPRSSASAQGPTATARLLQAMSDSSTRQPKKRAPWRHHPRDEYAEPYRFIDMGAQIATQALGENDPAVVDATLRLLPFAMSRYAHWEYQTVLVTTHEVAAGSDCAEGNAAALRGQHRGGGSGECDQERAAQSREACW